MANILIVLGILFIVINIYYFFSNKTYRKSYFSTILFRKLFLVFIGLTFGFAVIYYALSLNETIIMESSPSNKPMEQTFPNLLYFSGVTLLSIGYGDIVPVGSARFFSLLQAALGLLLPTAYFLKALDGSNDEDE
ncbi:potassium channel LctB [Gracilibacillus ureilyticus]|uniref:Potassium channel LctB n=1 Tax=Gracilibacillus ureilyticus TaxID=531814 RepID=A0A1H9R6C0_9BACI|nr:ion channel [Gracilibacillus ureilyticus]SER68075.1 potassium channel LctB [Gracilibacillus ureilyticus]